MREISLFTPSVRFWPKAVSQTPALSVSYREIFELSLHPAFKQGIYTVH